MRQVFLLLFCLFLSMAGHANALKGHPSPYLAMHGDDPVAWMEWGEAALAKAKKDNKLIFVSVGYFACHWCHVMHRESFKDKAIAKKLNEHYISVKVDRELNPVLDKRLIEFVTMTVGRAGWPLSVFITPEGYPLVGATYIPPEQFSKAVTDLANRWEKDQDKLATNARLLNLKLKTALEIREHTETEGALVDYAPDFIKAAMERADTLEGGLGSSMKFPSVPQLHTLLLLSEQRQNDELDAFLRLTLDAMAKKGLHDELAGGFFRYTVDPSWQTPHFEKMLYTNALMPMLYLDASHILKQPAYVDVALQTLAFLIREMQSPDGAYIASLSAVDDKNEEGGYYLWTSRELQKILTDDEFRLASVAWGLDQPNELVAGNLPMMQSPLHALATQLKIPETNLAHQLDQLKTKLLGWREKHRNIPKDDKLLSSWNGLVLAAFSSALPKQPQLRNEGEKLAEFLLKQWDGKRLKRATNSSKEGTLADYAAVSWGLLSWGKAIDSSRLQSIGSRIASHAWKHFYQEGNWLEEKDQLLPEGSRLTHLSDDPIPSAETLLLQASYLSDEKQLHQRADAVLEASSLALKEDIYSYASLLGLALSRNRQTTDLKNDTATPEAPKKRKTSLTSP